MFGWFRLGHEADSELAFRPLKSSMSSNVSTIPDNRILPNFAPALIVSDMITPFNNLVSSISTIFLIPNFVILDGILIILNKLD